MGGDPASRVYITVDDNPTTKNENLETNSSTKPIIRSSIMPGRSAAAKSAVTCRIPGGSAAVGVRLCSRLHGRAPLPGLQGLPPFSRRQGSGSSVKKAGVYSAGVHTESCLDVENNIQNRNGVIPPIRKSSVTALLSNDGDLPVVVVDDGDVLSSGSGAEDIVECLADGNSGEHHGMCEVRDHDMEDPSRNTCTKDMSESECVGDGISCERKDDCREVKRVRRDVRNEDCQSDGDLCGNIDEDVCENIDEEVSENQDEENSDSHAKDSSTCLLSVTRRVGTRRSGAGASHYKSFHSHSSVNGSGDITRRARASVCKQVLSELSQVAPEDENVEPYFARCSSGTVQKPGGLGDIIALNGRDKVRYPQWYSGHRGYYERGSACRLIWWRFKDNGKYQPGLAVDNLETEVNCGRLTEEVRDSLIANMRKRRGGRCTVLPTDEEMLREVIFVQNLEDLKYSVITIKVTKPRSASNNSRIYNLATTFPAGDDQAKLEKYACSSLLSLNALGRAKKILELREAYRSMENGDPGLLEDQLIDTFMREHIRPTVEIVKHIFTVHVDSIIQSYTSMPPGWSWDAYQQEQNAIEKRRHKEQRAAVAVEPTVRRGRKRKNFVMSNPIDDEPRTPRNTECQIEDNEDKRKFGILGIDYMIVNGKRVTLARTPPLVKMKHCYFGSGAVSTYTGSCLDDPMTAAAVGLSESDGKGDEQGREKSEELALEDKVVKDDASALEMLQGCREQQVRTGLLRGFSGVWIKMVKDITLSRRRLYSILKPVPLDLLHNPTLLFSPMPPLLQPAMVLEFALAHECSLIAAHLLVCNLMLHRLADVSAVRALDPAQKHMAVEKSAMGTYKDGVNDSATKRGAKSDGSRKLDVGRASRPKSADSVEDGSKRPVRFEMGYSVALTLGLLYGRCPKLFSSHANQTDLGPSGSKQHNSTRLQCVRWFGFRSLRYNDEGRIPNALELPCLEECNSNFIRSTDERHSEIVQNSTEAISSEHLGRTMQDDSNMSSLVPVFLTKGEIGCCESTVKYATAAESGGIFSNGEWSNAKVSGYNIYASRGFESLRKEECSNDYLMSDSSPDKRYIDVKPFGKAPGQSGYNFESDSKNTFVKCPSTSEGKLKDGDNAAEPREVLADKNAENDNVLYGFIENENSLSTKIKKAKLKQEERVGSFLNGNLKKNAVDGGILRHQNGTEFRNNLNNVTKRSNNGTALSGYKDDGELLIFPDEISSFPNICLLSMHGSCDDDEYLLRVGLDKVSDSPPLLSELERCFTTHGERFSLPVVDGRLSSLKKVTDASDELLTLIVNAHSVSRKIRDLENVLIDKWGPKFAAPSSSSRITTSAPSQTEAELSKTAESISCSNGKKVRRFSGSICCDNIKNKLDRNGGKLSISGIGFEDHQYPNSIRENINKDVESVETVDGKSGLRTGKCMPSVYDKPVDKQELVFDWQLRAISSRINQAQEAGVNFHDDNFTRFDGSQSSVVLPEYSQLFQLLRSISNALLSRKVENLKKSKSELALVLEGKKREEMESDARKIIEIYERKKHDNKVALDKWESIFNILLKLPAGTPPNPHIIKSHR